MFIWAAGGDKPAPAGSVTRRRASCGAVDGSRRAAGGAQRQPPWFHARTCAGLEGGGTLIWP